MKTNVCLLLFISSFWACNNNNKKAETTATTTTTTTVEKVDTPKKAAATLPQKDTAKEQVLTLNAIFVEFSLGDAEHYVFKDKSGKTWEFGGCQDKSLSFSEELPKAKANSTNQGWTSNKKLQKKWFNLKYTVKKQALYVDGPIGEVAIITEAKMVQ